MRSTRLEVLLGIAGATAVLGFGAMRLWDHLSSLPEVPSSAPLALLLLAVIVFAVALSLRAKLRQQRQRRSGAMLVDPLLAVRAVLLAKASSFAGSVVTGGYAGYGIYLLADLEVDGRRERAILCGLAAFAGGLLVVAALFLEHVCRVPPPSDELESDQPAVPT